MLGTLITAYLLVGAVVAALIWMILIASKRRQNKAKTPEPNHLQKPSTKPSNFQS